MVNNTGLKTILILAANPTNTSRLRLDEEIREIDEGLRRANRREQFKLEQKWAVRSRDFYRAILDYQPQIVHFCGHGAGQDGIILEDDTGKMVLLETRTLASMFKLFAKKSVECVILNACYSEVQAEAISQYVNYVLGMKQAIGDKAALAFSVAFYDALAAGYEVEEAYELGCSQMMSFLEQETPVLKKKPLIPAPIYTDIPNFEDVIPPNPYQGLAAFEEEDADFFFGQENFVNQLIEVTHQQPLVGVIGPSGSGKSSVVFAGLIPKLRKEGNWLIEIFRPGKDPFLPLAFALVRQLEPEAGETHKMREALVLASDFQQGRITVKQVIDQILERNSGKRVLLVADQFEELYTLCPGEEEQERFNNELLTAITQENVTLVFTLRADFYGYVLSYRPFRDALEQYTPQLLSSMKREELQQAIELPAQKLEVQLEENLTQIILDDVGQEPGNLPLLEFALTQLWEKQKHRRLTHQAYEEIGGIKRAIIKTAEQIYNQLSPQEQEQVRNIFVRLTRLDDRSVRSEQHRDTRRRVAMKELVPLDSNTNFIKDLVRRLADERLVVTSVDGVTGQEEVEVVHEALIQYWSRLQEWLNKDRENLQLRERIRQQALDWQLQTKDELLLLQGGRLEDAIAISKHQPTFFNQLEDSYIKGCLKLRERKHRQEVNRLRKWVGALSAALLVTVASGGVAFNRYQEAKKQERSATLALLRLESTKVKELLNSEPADAMVLAIKATGQSYQVFRKVLPEVQSSLYAAIDVPVDSNIFQSQDNLQPINSIAVSPDGRKIVSGSDDGTIRLWNQQGHLIVPPFKGDNTGVWSVKFSPDGAKIVSGGDNGAIRLWNIQGRMIVSSFQGHKSYVWSVAFSPDGSKIVSGGEDGTIRLWDIEGNPIRLLYQNPDQSIYSVAFNPKKQIIASGGSDGRVRLWDFKGKILGQSPQNPDNAVWSVTFSPDGNTIVSGSSDGKIRFWDLQGKLRYQSSESHNSPVYSVAFSADGNRVVSGGRDEKIRLWDTEGNLMIQPIQGHKRDVLSVAFNPDSKTIVSGSSDGTVRLWNLEDNIIREYHHMQAITSVTFSPNGQKIVTGNQDKTLRLWNVDGQPISQLFQGHTEIVTSVAFSPDGQKIVSGSEDKTLHLWNIKGELMGQPFKGHTSGVTSVAFSSDGQKIISGSWDTTLRLWNIDSQLTTQVFKGHTDVVTSVAFSPNQNLVASSSLDKTIRLWSLDGNCIKVFQLDGSPVRKLAFSPNGTLIIAGTEANNLYLLNLREPGSNPIHFKGHQQSVTAVAFNPNNDIVASGSTDKSLRFWDLNGNQIGEQIYPSAITSIAFSPDGQTIVSGSQDATLRLSRAGDWTRWLHVACKKLEEHPILVKQQTLESQIADETCQRYVFNKSYEKQKN